MTFDIPDRIFTVEVVVAPCTCIDCELKLRSLFLDDESQRQQAEHDKRLETP